VTLAVAAAKNVGQQRSLTMLPGLMQQTPLLI